MERNVENDVTTTTGYCPRYFRSIHAVTDYLITKLLLISDYSLKGLSIVLLERHPIMSLSFERN
jgi:hypothetical protein